MSCNQVQFKFSPPPSDVLLAPLVEPHLITKGADSFTCAIKQSAGGIVKCWGTGLQGELGNGFMASSASAVQVSGITNAVSIAGTDSHTCVILNDRSVKCWGRNSGFGFLGNGSYVDSAVPVSVVLEDQAIQIDATDSFTCALLANQKVFCWGANASGQLGNGNMLTQPSPVEVTGINDAVKISVGTSTACALDINGDAQCWGENAYGHLDDGGTMDSPTPIATTTIGNIKTMAQTSRIACAIVDDGLDSAYCWGQAAWITGGIGNLGSTAVPGFNGAVSFSAGYRHICALMDDASVKCMGYNNNGQLGDGNIAAVVGTTPVPVISLPANIVEVQAQEDGSCALSSTGNLYCWGRDHMGQLGDGQTTNSGTPVQATVF